MKNFTLYTFVRMQSLLKALKDDSGQDLVEYALIDALIALAAVLGMNVLATAINQAFSKVGSKLSTYSS